MITFRRTIGSDRERTVRDALKTSDSKTLSVDAKTLQALQDAQHDDLWVFGQDGKPRRPDWLTAVYRKLQDSQGVDLGGVHVLRHFHATWLIDQGLSPVRVARRLGHKKVSTTMDIYAHRFSPDDDDIAALMEDGL